MRSVNVVAGLVVLGLFAGVVWNQESGKRPADPKKKADDKPAVHTVAKKPFRIERTVKGILSPSEAVEISYRPLAAPTSGRGELTIRSIAEHGSRVKAGDVVIAFESTRLDESIDVLEVEQKSLQADIKLAEEELPNLEKAAPVELAAAEQAKKLADEELKYFLDTDRTEREKSVNMRVKMYKFWKEYAEEELKQLEKMYKANDLTEETERIILRRQRNYVEMETYFYQAALVARDQVLKYALPNAEKALREAQAKQGLQLEKLRQTQGPALEQKRTQLAKQRHDRARNADRLAKLNKDRDALTVRAPFDGILYHGKFQRGQWTFPESLASRLVMHGVVNFEETLMTVVKARPVAMRVTVDEKDAHWFKVGVHGTARLAFQPDRKLTASVTSAAPVPASPGQFACQIAVDLGDGDSEAVPGMAVSVKFVLYSKKDALAVPAACVHEEDDKHFVCFPSADGGENRREVTVGRTDDGRTEILTGLREGDQILLERAASKVAGKSPSGAKGATP
jgi:hypothetical protein